ncbi:MAG: hypothetical protein IKO80_09495, partial [Lachnospiraceae bacterium]|nr:hypothetical protein [Lachnospiraceae bacterium]
IGGDLIVKAGTFECRDFSYRGMHLEVNVVAFQAGACDEEIDEDTNEPVEGTGSHIYIGAPDDEYADEVIYPENNGSIELTGDTYRETNPRIYFNVGTGHPSLVPAALFGNGVCIGPNVIIYADGLQLGSVNVHTEARDQYDNEIPTGTLTTKRLPQILLTNEDFEGEDYTGFVPHTLHVYGHVFSDGLHDCPLLKVGLDLNKDGEPDGEGEQDEPLEAGDTVYFYDEQSEVAPGFENAHIRVGTHKEYDEDLEEEVDVTDSTGNSSITYVVAGSDTLRWGRAKDEYGILQDGMILVDPDSLPLELEYLVGGTVEPGAQGFLFRKGEQTGGSSVERFADFREASSFLRTLNGDVAAVLTISGDIRDGGNLDLSWTTVDEDGSEELHGVTTLYVVGEPGEGDLDGQVIVDSSTEGHYGETVFTEMPNVAVYLDDQVKWVYRRFDLRGTGDILYLGSEALTGETVRDGFLDNMDVYVPCGTVRLGDPHITSDMTVDLNDTRLDACRILVHGGAWRVHRILVRAGKLKNGSPVSTNYQMESNAGLLGLADGGAGMLQIVKYHQKRDSSTPEATSAHSILVADTIDVMRNVQPNWIEEEYELGFKFTVMERDVYDEIILREEEIYTEDKAPEARILVGKGAQLTSPHGINGQSRYIQEPHYDEIEEAYVKWDGELTVDPDKRYDVEMLDTEELNPVYASPVLWSDGTVEIERSDLYGLVLGADSLTTVNANLHMLTQNKLDEDNNYIEYTGEDGKTGFVKEAMAGSYTWLESDAAILTQADGHIEFNGMGLLGNGGVRAFVPLSIEEEWYRALDIRGGEPEASTYQTMAENLKPVLTTYLGTLGTAAAGSATLQVGMYKPKGEILEGWDDPVNIPVFFDENGAMHFMQEDEDFPVVPLEEITSDLTVLGTDENWSDERQQKVQILKEETKNGKTTIVPVTGRAPSFSWWNGKDEYDDLVGNPGGILRFSYPFALYRYVYHANYDEEGEPLSVDRDFGDDAKDEFNGTPSFLGGFSTWKEVVDFIKGIDQDTPELWERDPDTGEPVLDPVLDPETGEQMLDPETGEPIVKPRSILDDDWTIPIPGVCDNGEGENELVLNDDWQYLSYVVKFASGQSLGANPATPDRTQELFIEGYNPGATLSFTGTMTLNPEWTTFHGVKLDAKTAIINVNDNRLDLLWTTGRIGTLKGKKAVETSGGYRYPAAGTVKIVSDRYDQWGYDWFEEQEAAHERVDLYITQGITTLGTLLVDVQVSYPVFVNAGPENSNAGWKPVTVGELDFVAGKFATGALTAEVKLDAGGETEPDSEDPDKPDIAHLSVSKGKLTVNGEAIVYNGREVMTEDTSAGDIYVKENLYLDTQSLVQSAKTIKVDGDVVMGETFTVYVEDDAVRSTTLQAATDLTVGGRLFSVSEGNALYYGGKLTLKDVKVGATRNDSDDILTNGLLHDEVKAGVFTMNMDEDVWRPVWNEDEDAECPVNAVCLVYTKLASEYDYLADPAAVNVTVTGAVEIVDFQSADLEDTETAETPLTNTAILFFDPDPDHGEEEQQPLYYLY